MISSKYINIELMFNKIHLPDKPSHIISDIPGLLKGFESFCIRPLHRGDPAEDVHFLTVITLATILYHQLLIFGKLPADAPLAALLIPIWSSVWLPKRCEARLVTFVIIGNRTWVQILDKAVCISISTDVLEKDLNCSLPRSQSSE